MTNLRQSIDIRAMAPGRRRLLGFVGPAAMVSVGFMDPGNWATDLEGGARFGYQLLWVLLASNLIALLLQSLAARLGIVAGRDLAQACREFYAPPVAFSLWFLCEIAIIACDLAEVLGSAIALNLLFGIPLVWGALITALDVMLILAMQHYGIRRLEAVIAVMVATIAACLAVEIFLAAPDWKGVAGGFVPQLNSASLYVAIGLLGATVMPHNLYLHSSLVQTRRIGSSVAAKREAIRYNAFDTALALNLAFVVNAAILVLSAAVFFRRGIEVTELQQAHQLLTPLLGASVASIAFAIAMLAAGQSATITSTLAGQLVMQGFLRIRLSPVLVRSATRALALLPAIGVLNYYGEQGVLQLLILSQVVLSLQLPFAMVPLIRFTSDARIMGHLVSARWVNGSAWLAAGAITALNGWLVVKSLGELTASWSPQGGGLYLLMFGVAALYALLLGWIALAPLHRNDAALAGGECDMAAQGG
jgi:manganese transport protein